jgi:hypothetical protein
LKHLKHLKQTLATCSFSATSPLLLGRMEPHRRVEFFPSRRGLHASKFRLGHGELGRRGTRCAWASDSRAAVSYIRASSTPGRTELGTRRRRSSWPLTRHLPPMLEAAAVSLAMGGRHSMAGGARVYAASGDARCLCICGHRRRSCGHGR